MQWQGLLTTGVTVGICITSLLRLFCAAAPRCCKVYVVAASKPTPVHQRSHRRVQWEPVVCCMPAATEPASTAAAALTFSVAQRWDSSCTHLVVLGAAAPISGVVACAVAARRPIVRPNWCVCVASLLPSHHANKICGHTARDDCCSEEQQPGRGARGGVRCECCRMRRQPCDPCRQRDGCRLAACQQRPSLSTPLPDPGSYAATTDAATVSGAAAVVGLEGPTAHGSSLAGRTCIVAEGVKV